MNDFERTLRHRLSSTISKGSKPKIGILMPKTGIVWDDLMGGIGEANKHYSFVVFKCPMNNPKEIAVCLSDMDQADFDAIALIRGGGNFLESLDTPVVLKAIARLETPFIIAAGHFVDNPVIQMIASMTCGTPTMLGVELGRIVEDFKREKPVDSSESEIDQGLQKSDPGILENDEYHPDLMADKKSGGTKKSAFIKIILFSFFVLAFPMAIYHLTSDDRLTVAGAILGTFVFSFAVYFVSQKKKKTTKRMYIQPDSPKIDQKFDYSDFFMNQCEPKQKKEPEKTICKAQAAFTKFVAFVFLVLMIPLLFFGATNSEMNFVYAMLSGSSIFACICVYVSKRTYDPFPHKRKLQNVGNDEDEESFSGSRGVIDDGLGFLNDDNFMFSGFDF